MVRTRVIQTLYSLYEDPTMSRIDARKQLKHRFDDTYKLYMLLLLVPDALTRYAQERKETDQAKAKAMHKHYTPETNLINNRIVTTMDGCNALRNYAEHEKLSWDAGHPLIEDIYNRLMTDEKYIEYRVQESPSYEDDRNLYRYIYSTLLLQSPALEDSMEELELQQDGVNWTTDVEFITTFVIKTLRKAEEGVELQLMPLWDSPEEEQFASELLESSMEEHTESEELINQSLKGWDKDRVAKMDRILLETAIAEIKRFPDIALQISMNEYIELSKEFSSERSFLFINGCLNHIVKKLKIINKQPC